MNVCSQSLEQQHYSNYDEQHLKPIMQLMAKNVVLVNEGRSKFLVSLQTEQTPELDVNIDWPVDLSVGSEEEILQQQTDEDQPHSSAQLFNNKDDGRGSAESIKQDVDAVDFNCTLFKFLGHSSNICCYWAAGGATDLY